MTSSRGLRSKRVIGPSLEFVTKRGGSLVSGKAAMVAARTSLISFSEGPKVS